MHFWLQSIPEIVFCLTVSDYNWWRLRSSLSDYISVMSVLHFSIKEMWPSVALTCRLSVLVMLALGNEMLTLVLLVLSSHLESSSMLRSLSNLCRPSTWKGSRSTTLALLPQRGASRTCTMFSMSSWKRYKPGGKSGKGKGGNSCGSRVKRGRKGLDKPKIWLLRSS